MTKPITFNLKDESLNKNLGTVSFNGKFVFELNKEVPLDYWNHVGFIPLAPDQKKVESPDLFYYLNSRLPIGLRKQSSALKLDYMKETGLRVASDSLVLTLA